MGASLLVPLIVAPGLYYPFVTSKALFFRPVITLTLAACLAHALSVGQPILTHPARWSPVTRAGAVYVAALTVSTALAVDPTRSFWSTLERMDGLVGILHLAAFYLALTATLNTRRAWGAVVHGGIGVSVLVAIAAWWMGGDRLGGTLGGPTFLAAWLVPHAIAAAWQWARRPTAFLWPAILALQLATLYRTGTRAAVVALVAAAVVATLRARGRARALLVVAGVAATLTVAAVRWGGAAFGLHSLPARLASTSSGEVRFTIWQIALAGIRERPVLGWGLDGYSLVYARHYIPAPAMPSWADRAHDGPLDQLVAGGVVGLAAWLALLATAAVGAARRRDLDPVDRTALLALLAAWFAGGLFGFDDLSGSLAIVTILAGIAAGARPAPATTLGAPRSRRALPAVALAASAAMAVAVNLGPLRVARDLGVASAPGTPPGERVERLAHAFRFDRSAAVGDALADVSTRWILRSPSVPAEVRVALTTLGTAELIRIADDAPHDARAQLTAGSFLSDVGDLHAARRYLGRARALAPRMPGVLVAVAIADLTSGDYPGALEAARSAHAADRRAERITVVYSASLVLTGDIDGAAAVLRDRGRRRPRVLLDPRVVGAWLAVDRADVLRALWWEEVERNPGFRTRLEAWSREQRLALAGEDP